MMPSFSAPEWRPVREWAARLLCRLAAFVQPPCGTGRHHVVASDFDMDAPVRLHPFEESINHNIEHPPADIDPYEDLLWKG